MNVTHNIAQFKAQHIVFAQDWVQDTSIECPREITALLAADDKLQIFAIFDGTRRASVRGLNDLDTLPPEVAAAPLFKPDTPEGDAGPWLLSFGRAQGVQASVLRDHFRKFQGFGVGILLLTSATEPELRSHLRGLMKVAKDAEAKTMLFFRYWDPVTANEFLPSLAAQPARLERFFYTQKGTPIHFLAEHGADALNMFQVSGPARAPAARTHFTLAECDAPVMARIVRIALANNLSRWLKRDYASELFASASHSELGPHILREGQRFGFTRQDEFSYLGHLMVHLGGWFHQSGQTPALLAILESDARSKHIPLRAAFTDAWAGSYRAVRRDFCDKFTADPQLAIVDGDQITLCPDGKVLAARLHAHIPINRQGPFRQLWKKSQDSLALAGAPDTHSDRLAFLSLFWGYRFYEDPFLGRKHPPQSAHEWDTTCNDFWKALAHD